MHGISMQLTVLLIRISIKDTPGNDATAAHARNVDCCFVADAAAFVSSERELDTMHQLSRNVA